MPSAFQCCRAVVTLCGATLFNYSIAALFDHPSQKQGCKRHAMNLIVNLIGG
jgi:hypothetical protein